MAGRKIDEALKAWATDRQIEIIDAINGQGGIKAAARFLGLTKATVQEAVKSVEKKAAKAASEDEEDPKPLFGGRVRVFDRYKEPVPDQGIRRYILTTAQNNTPVHDQFWDNLLKFAEYVGAEIKVSTFAYNHNAYGQLSVKPGTNKTQESLWYDPKIVPYINNHHVEIAPSLVWCGEMNISPTAVNPLSGLETYTGRKSGVFPATKMSMRSVISAKHEPTKFNYTTGTVTVRNYIQKKAGQKAEFHHAYGALIVEVDSDGDWFVRQLLADEDGTFYDVPATDKDLNDLKASTRAKGGKVTSGHGVEAITWGDLHAEVVDPMVMEVAWTGERSMLDELEPAVQFLHDTLDFRRRNHHDARDPHKAFRKHVRGIETVEGEVQVTADVVNQIYRQDIQTVIVDSNHDNAMMRWLREADYRTDPANARYFLKCSLEVYERIERGEDDFHLVEWALRAKGVPEDVRFLRQDEPYVICRDKGGGIECGMHGDLGGNGARGSPNSLKRMGRKANTGHTHSAGIYDGLWVAGLTAKLEQGYNVGPGSWSHSQIVVYPSGKRTMITIWNGKWRA